MTYRPHLRCSALGTLPGGEVFSFGVSMASDPEGNIAIPIYEPNNTVWNDLRDDFVTYWQSLPIDNRAKLMSVKFANIGADGLYTSAPVERGVGANNLGVSGSADTAGTVHNQDAIAVTLHTAADMGRIKGRFFLPMPYLTTGSDGLIAEGWRDNIETASATFLSNLNNQPGIDVLDLKVVVASQGRFRNDGTKENPNYVQRVAPGNHTVTSVSVGRVLDTQRRRRNKLKELRGTPTAVSG